jgi:HTH-type transcriptional repressor of NAD biosynthesis genes
VCSIAREPIPGDLRFGWVAESHPDCRVLHVTEEVPQEPAEHPDFWPIWVDLIGRHAGKVDVVFTSETYGDELARRLGARHVSVDPLRQAFPISGSAIRADPMKHWDFIPPAVRPFYVRRVAILGAESTGKTTLAHDLARAMHTVVAEEYGRTYCEGRDARDLVLADFEAIGREQLRVEAEAARSANRVLICDTDLRTTCTWSDMIAGARSEWVEAAAGSQRYDLVLLLDSDVPWINDGTRVLGDRRAEHTERLRRELERTGQPFVLLQGAFERRLEIATGLIRQLASLP